MINLVSLGMSCQSTHQLDFFARQNPQKVVTVKSPFDWLICPPDSAAAWLEAGLCDFEPDEIVEHLERAYWPQYKLWFWHGFIDRTGGQRVLDLAGLAENELSKLRYLREKFRSLDISRTVFVVSNTQNNLDTEVFDTDEREHYEMTEASIDRLQIALDRFYGASVNLQLATRADRAESSLLQRPNVTVLAQDRSNSPGSWKGDKLAWDRFLSQVRH